MTTNTPPEGDAEARIEAAWREYDRYTNRIVTADRQQELINSKARARADLTRLVAEKAREDARREADNLVENVKVAAAQLAQETRFRKMAEAERDRLAEALRKIAEHEVERVYRTPEEVAESDACAKCQEYRKAQWPPLGLCLVHERPYFHYVHINEHAEKYQHAEMRQIARAALAATTPSTQDGEQDGGLPASAARERSTGRTSVNDPTLEGSI